MNLLTEAMNGRGAAVLPVVAALLLEELTYGGLVRLLVAPWPGTEKRGERNDPGGLKKLGNLDNFNKLSKQKGEGK